MISDYTIYRDEGRMTRNRNRELDQEIGITHFDNINDRILPCPFCGIKPLLIDSTRERLPDLAFDPRLPNRLGCFVKVGRRPRIFAGTMEP